MNADEAQSVSRGQARRRAMMDAAWDVVLDKGFTAITLNDIISRSGGSKSTLYEQFGDKDGLLRDVMQEKCDEFSAELHLTLDTSAPPQNTLREFARLIVKKVLEDEVVRFVQLLLAEGHLFPKLLQGFLCGGPERTDQRLARYLSDMAQAGKLNITDPQLSAHLLLDMLSGRWTETLKITQLSGPELEAFRRNAQKKADAAVDLFLAATLPR